MADQHYPLYNAEQLQDVLAAMAAQTFSVFGASANITLVGIVRRGEPLARYLRDHLQAYWPQAALPVFPLRVKRYADDLQLLHPETALAENPELAACDFDNTAILLVDDVLYEGHSLLRASAYLARLGARELRTAVLVDRCCNKLPVKADICGLRLTVPAGDVIECRVPPYEPTLQVDIWHRAP